jgi:citrate synthase
VLRALKQMPAAGDPMGALIPALGTLALEHSVAVPPTLDAALEQGLWILGSLPTLIAARIRLERGERPVAPRKSLGYAANFLAMLTGAPPATESARAFESALILRADNELTPSTFAARVAASTGADVFGALMAGWSSLAGPRHGWHARNVFRVLEEIGGAENVDAWVTAHLARKEKIPGFGHQVYQGEDPRSELLRRLTQAECERAGQTDVLRTAQGLERAVRERTGQYPIVDFYLAVLYAALGIPKAYFTLIFALSRAPGFLAHVVEQYGDEGMIRPRAEYIGPGHRQYVPLRSRKS